jgi:hypothetical protein
MLQKLLNGILCGNPGRSVAQGALPRAGIIWAVFRGFQRHAGGSVHLSDKPLRFPATLC